MIGLRSFVALAFNFPRSARPSVASFGTHRLISGLVALFLSAATMATAQAQAQADDVAQSDVQTDRATAPPRPNVILIVTDDQGWHDVGYHNDQLRTPTMDRLAAAGVELDCHYVQPQCTPTRVALMTGRYPSRFGAGATGANNYPAFPLGTPTMANLFKDHGYDTGLFGKWHLGSTEGHGPDQFGFDTSYGSLAGAVGMYDHRYRLNTPFTDTWHRDGELLDPDLDSEQGHVTDLVTNAALAFITVERDAPYFCYIPYHAVHTPLVEREERWFEINAHIEHEDRRLFAAALTHLDHAIGRIVTTLEARGELDDTLIIFTSDNGGLQGRYGGGNYPEPDPALEAGFSSNLPLRGGKTTAFEGGMRVPAFVHWPNRLTAHRLETPMHVTDWLPTLTALLGDLDEPAHAINDANDNVDHDGRNMLPFLLGDATAYAEPRTFYWVWGGRKWEALRHGDWKIVRQQEQDWMLFNLREDPNETTNRAETETQRLESMRDRYREQRALDASF